MYIITVKWVVEKSRRSESGCAASVSPRIPSALPRDLFISTAPQMSAFFIKEDEINRRSIVIAGVLSLLFHCGDLCARSITAHQAEKAVQGWLGVDARPLQTILGRQSRKTQSFADKAGEPIYYVVYLEPSGFVIVSADDELEPIICFADDGVAQQARRSAVERGLRHQPGHRQCGRYAGPERFPRKLAGRQQVAQQSQIRRVLPGNVSATRLARQLYRRITLDCRYLGRIANHARSGEIL